MRGTVYVRDDRGTLDRVDCLSVDGDIYLGQSTYPIEIAAKVGSTDLAGWGRGDGVADVYATPGYEIVVPERLAARFARLAHTRAR